MFLGRRRPFSSNSPSSVGGSLLAPPLPSILSSSSAARHRSSKVPLRPPTPDGVSAPSTLSNVNTLGALGTGSGVRLPPPFFFPSSEVRRTLLLLADPGVGEQERVLERDRLLLDGLGFLLLGFSSAVLLLVAGFPPMLRGACFTLYSGAVYGWSEH